MKRPDPRMGVGASGARNSAGLAVSSSIVLMGRFEGARMNAKLCQPSQ